MVSNLPVVQLLAVKYDVGCAPSKMDTGLFPEPQNMLLYCQKGLCRRDQVYRPRDRKIILDYEGGPFVITHILKSRESSLATVRERGVMMEEGAHESRNADILRRWKKQENG